MPAKQRQPSKQQGSAREAPVLDVVIEVPRWSFLKRGSTGQLDFVSPFPCPFNYGSVDNYVGLDGDLLDAVILGPRLSRGTRVSVQVHGAVGLTDRSMYDDKLICGHYSVSRRTRFLVLLFFRFYARCKWVLNYLRGRPGHNACEGWGDAAEAIARARPRRDLNWNGPVVPF